MKIRKVMSLILIFMFLFTSISSANDNEPVKSIKDAEEEIITPMGLSIHIWNLLGVVDGWYHYRCYEHDEYHDKFNYGPLDELVEF